MGSIFAVSPAGNTRGIFSGQYCDECQCKHLGICAITENTKSSSRWGCRCPSHQKWVGTLCDKCYAKEHTSEVCRGECVSEDGIYKHYGSKCNTVCMPDAFSFSARCLEVSSGGGTCNACSGHGTCTGAGTCKCNDGWFTSRDGEQCSMECKDAGIICPEERGTCSTIGILRILYTGTSTVLVLQ